MFTIILYTPDGEAKRSEREGEEEWGKEEGEEEWGKGGGERRSEEREEGSRGAFKGLFFSHFVAR